MFLTKQGGLFVGPISRLLGIVINLIYNFFSNLGIESVAITVIVFTVFVRLLIFPLNLNATKSGKISSYIQPEIDKVTKKYKGKKDQESMMAMQRETNAIRQKYGVSMTGGCLPLLLQFPIIIALFRVTQNIPAYIGKIKDLYQPIANAIFENKNAIDVLTKFQADNSNLKNIKLVAENKDTIIDVLSKFTSENWNEYASQVGGSVADAIHGNVDKIDKVYTLFGDINITSIYGLAFSAALIVPIIATVFQILMTVTTPQQTSDDPTQQSTANVMKKMSIFISIVYFFVCAFSPLSFGLYFATTAVFSFLINIVSNFYYSKCDMEKLVNKAKAKATKKAEQRKQSGKKTFMERMQEAAEANGQAPNGGSTSRNISKNVATTNLKNYSSNVSSSNQYREGSLASKANVMQRYSDNNGGKK